MFLRNEPERDMDQEMMRENGKKRYNKGDQKLMKIEEKESFCQSQFHPKNCCLKETLQSQSLK